MARNCPNKKYKRNQSFKQKRFKNRQESSWRQRPNAFNKRLTTFQKRPFGRNEYVKSAQIEEIDEEEETDLLPPKIDVADLAVKTAALTEEQREEWVENMTNLGVDFHEA
jgi:hypothetical protein